MKNRAFTEAGYREKFAMEHGKRSVKRDHRGHTLWIYRYSTEIEYQDANGATYDATEGKWIG